MKAFYGTRLSPHMTKTPEGFLICSGVPICRTGVQDYLPREIGVEGSDILHVTRDDAEVFKPAAIASFEGKPVTDDHPPGDVNPANYATYTKGTVQNVRRGTGDDADKLICDLVIYDSALISKIEAGKRDISCGYECKYVPDSSGAYFQRDIIGNHVAVVDTGRAGHAVAIKDSKPQEEEREEKRMKKSIFQRMFAAFVKDADPEEIQEAAEAVKDAECGEIKEKVEVEDEEPKAERDDFDKVFRMIEEINAKVDKMKDDLVDHYEVESKTEDEDELAKLEGELTTDEDETEEDETEIVEAEEEEKADDEDKTDEEKPMEAKDKAYALAAIRALKPVIATLPPYERRKANDALSKAIKKTLDRQTSQPLPGGYAALAKRKTGDAAVDPRAFGEACRKRNPHIK